jgi:hypothetical protein
VCCSKSTEELISNNSHFRLSIFIYTVANLQGYMSIKYVSAKDSLNSLLRGLEEVKGHSGGFHTVLLLALPA